MFISHGQEVPMTYPVSVESQTLTGSQISAPAENVFVSTGHTDVDPTRHIKLPEGIIPVDRSEALAQGWAELIGLYA